MDRDGHLVVIVHDFVLEFPAPAATAKGLFGAPPAKIYRIIAPQAEFVFSLNLVPDPSGGPGRLVMKVENFDEGPGATILTIFDDESKTTTMNRFTSGLVFKGFGNQLRTQSFDAPLGSLNLPGFALTSVSPIDPTGWMRVVLSPTR